MTSSYRSRTPLITRRCLSEIARRSVRQIARRSVIAALGVLASAGVTAQSALLADIRTIATADTATPVEHTFAVVDAGTYKVTLTDLGAALPVPAPLVSAKMAITQGSTVVATLQSLTSGVGAISFAATANTSYTLHIVGSPASGVASGAVGEDVLKPDGSSFQSYVDDLTIPTAPVANGESILNDTFTVANIDNYTITLADLALPKALKTLILALVPNGGGSVVATLASASQTTVQLAPGSYRIVAIGKMDPADATAVGGLFTVTVTGTSGAPPYPTKAVHVGAVTLVGTAALSAGNYALTLADLGLPAALTQTGAALVRDDGTLTAGPLAAAGSQPFTVAASGSNYLAFALATPAASPGAGSYAVSVLQQPASGIPPLSTARAVSTSSTLTPYSFDTTIQTAGSYVVALTDFQFPSPLTSASLAAVQGGAFLGTPLSASGNFTVTAAQGPLTLLAFGQAMASGALLGIDVSPSAGGSPAFDVTQGVGAAFRATQLNVATAQNLQVTGTDLLFPAALSNFSIAVTQGTKRVGSIISAGASGTFKFDATPGTYFVNVVAQPTGTDKAGTYLVSVAPTPPAPIVTLMADSTTINPGATVHLTWTTQNATSCTGSGGSGWNGTKDPAGGTTQTSALTADTTFTLTCTGPGGSTPTTLTVKVTTPTSAAHSGGGGLIDLRLLLVLAALILFRALAANEKCAGASPRR